MKKIKLFPLVMTILSGLYVIVTALSEDYKYEVDTVGGDPGGKVLPLLMGGFLFLGFLYLTIKERPDGKKMDKGTLVLFIITLLLSIVYVALLKTIGFVVLTTVLIYCLLYLYTTIGEKRNAVQGTVGGIATVAVTVGFYTVMRLISKNIISLGRKGALPAFFGKSAGGACVALVFVAIITVVLALTLIKFLKKKGLARVADSAIITMATVLFLYVVFKQFFQVNLAPGLIKY